MTKLNPDVTDYLNKAKHWQPELKRLRKILLDCELKEEFKWRNPCYTLDESNIALIGSFKDSCVLSFFKGAFIKDHDGSLSKPGENTRSARVIRFTSIQEIDAKEATLKALIGQAIEIEKAGLKVDFESSQEVAIPDELQRKLVELPAFQRAFEALTPGRRRAYILYFSAAKQPATRESRIEKYLSQILDGKGINDCTCGLSRKMPQCDGSHKNGKP